MIDFVLQCSQKEFIKVYHSQTAPKTLETSAWCSAVNTAKINSKQVDVDILINDQQDIFFFFLITGVEKLKKKCENLRQWNCNIKALEFSDKRWIF